MEIFLVIIVLAMFSDVVNSFIAENITFFVVSGLLVIISVITYVIINGKIWKQRNDLMNEVLNSLDLRNIDRLLRDYDTKVIVQSRQTLDNYDKAKFLKNNNCFDEVKKVVRKKNDIKRNIKAFLNNNEFGQRPQYEFVADRLENYLPLTDGYRVRIVYITYAGNKKDEKLICFNDKDIREFEDHPEWLMTKGEYNKMLKEKTKEELKNKKHSYYNKVNSIIDFANNAKDILIAKSRAKRLDELIQQLFDGTINSIQKIKKIDSDEWDMLDRFIDDIDTQVQEIAAADKKISDYYKSDDFKRIKDTCNSLNVSRKEFNEYIEEKAQSIARLFGTRIVRNETQYKDIYNYVRSYRKSITPFTAEVSATVFGSAENNPIDYIIKCFYPNKSQYTQQIQKLRVLIEELETLKEAKVIIDNYKKDYDQYIKNVPAYILEDDEDGFYSRLGLAVINEEVLNVEYRFAYTSEGGMARRFFTVPMNEENIIELIERLENKLSQEALTKEQRALMTTKLRAYIKERDNYTCCSCSNSINKEPNLLLEIDHIIPIAKGGLTTEENLQTLCWKCNRGKGAKILA